MASLMQEFAEARQRRLQDRADFLAEQQLAREQRERDLQVQSEETTKYLAHAEQTRLAWEQGRQAIAENALESRREEVQNRAEQVSEFLEDLNTSRTEQAIEDSEQRAQEVRTRTFKTRSQLKHIRKARIRAGQADQAQRQQLVQDRAVLTQMQLEDLNKTRLANATVDAQHRAQEFSDRVANVKASLKQIEANRIAEAEAQNLKLKAFRAELGDSVWSGSRSVAVGTPPANPQPVVATKPTEVSSSKQKKKNTKAEIVESPAPEPVIAKSIEVKESPNETSKPSGKIEQFVIDYVSQLSTNSSLLAVVNDRDTVRDLLAQGANTLKVDPSDILNTLLQMAENSSS
ncbi:hypothetical protein PseudUWO311_19390 [Pseudanabaena sp. UWO311]|uniref:hypothetical protein n=1 Tax=Pseudanabaena sp. UWO311 TaxID=2487337 RepID=UPI00115A6F5E|nr:hypothetical protein [Pseudanabaena sp. UWO311]TYQ24339.1 hypothetical protein PseudUWO311_19390 [Pseudanabaena sp. UWO311]